MSSAFRTEWPLPEWIPDDDWCQNKYRHILSCHIVFGWPRSGGKQGEPRHICMHEVPQHNTRTLWPHRPAGLWCTQSGAFDLAAHAETKTRPNSDTQKLSDSLLTATESLQEGPKRIRLPEHGLDVERRQVRPHVDQVVSPEASCRYIVGDWTVCRRDLRCRMLLPAAPKRLDVLTSSAYAF